MAALAEQTMTASDPMVRARDLVKEFESPDGAVVGAVNGVSFDVMPGEFIALTGQSGCGKTTLLRLLMGLMLPTSGQLDVAGVPVHGCDHRRAMVFQNAELLPWRSAIGNVTLGLETKRVARHEREQIARRYLALVGLSGAEARRPDQLSGGMKQRVGLARALAVDPDLLLMDEPFAALDAHTREGLQAELIRLHEEMRKTIVFVTHDLDEAVLLADRVLILSPDGRLAETVEIPIPRRRLDPERIRTTSLFGEKRYQIWLKMKQLEATARDRSQSPSTGEVDSLSPEGKGLG
jgi:NitT/TauT family transport system ATP-binding protein